MPFPYGGKATYSDLAGKFGWPTVIISPLLLPFTFLFTNLLAYPFFIPRKYKYTSLQHAWYLEGEDLWRQKAYFNKESEFGFFPGWSCYIDKEGGKFYESIWGFMNCLDAEIHDDHINLVPNKFSWVIGKIWAEFPPAPVKGHRIRFYFGNGGINWYNPFCWCNIMFCLTALTMLNLRGLPAFKSKYPMRNAAVNYPPEDDPTNDETKMRPDGSMVYTDPDDKADSYGSIS